MGVILALQRLRFGSATASRKGVITPPGVTANPLCCTLCTIALLPLATLSQVLALSNWQLACLIFCGLNTTVGYGALAEAMARWQAAQVSALITLTPLFTLLFRFIITGLARCFRQTDVKPVRLSRCVCRGCGRDVFRHRPPSLVAYVSVKRLYRCPAQANDFRE